MNNPQIGQEVVRIKGDYVVGRTGKIVEVDEAKRRVRVAWNGSPRTWVKTSVVAIAPIREKPRLLMGKGEKVNYLDYLISNTPADGLVLYKVFANNYETHLGNFGEPTAENLLLCKKYAVIYFMLKRPEAFAVILCRKIHEVNSGAFLEYNVFATQCEGEGLDIPKEVTPGDGVNRMIYFDGKPLTIAEDVERVVIEI